MAASVTPKQVQLFTELLERKQFPESAPDAAELMAQFEQLTRANASKWIDNALKLPNADDDDDSAVHVDAPF